MSALEVSLGPQYVEVLCRECVIRVEAGFPDWPCVEVSLIMGHSPAGGWRYRLREAWTTFRGEGRNWYEFYTRKEVDDFIAALERAKPTLPL